MKVRVLGGLRGCRGSSETKRVVGRERGRGEDRGRGEKVGGEEGRKRRRG